MSPDSCYMRSVLACVPALKVMRRHDLEPKHQQLDKPTMCLPHPQFLLEARGKPQRRRVEVTSQSSHPQSKSRSAHTTSGRKPWDLDSVPALLFPHSVTLGKSPVCTAAPPSVIEKQRLRGRALRSMDAIDSISSSLDCCQF